MHEKLPEDAFAIGTDRAVYVCEKFIYLCELALNNALNNRCMDVASRNDNQTCEQTGSRYLATSSYFMKQLHKSMFFWQDYSRSLD